MIADSQTLGLAGRDHSANHMQCWRGQMKRCNSFAVKSPARRWPMNAGKQRNGAGHAEDEATPPGRSRLLHLQWISDHRLTLPLGPLCTGTAKRCFADAGRRSARSVKHSPDLAKLDGGDISLFGVSSSDGHRGLLVCKALAGLSARRVLSQLNRTSGLPCGALHRQRTYDEFRRRIPPVRLVPMARSRKCVTVVWLRGRGPELVRERRHCYRVLTATIPQWMVVMQLLCPR